MTVRLAASNIAWDPTEDDDIASVLRSAGFTGVEVAPTKRWESPLDATARDIADYRAHWADRGLAIVAMQALLFGRPDLQLFGPAGVRRALCEYLTGLIELAHGLGAHALVFGSPKNRKRGSMPVAEANAIATDFFRELGAVALARQCVICIEPNPPAYDCDFVNSTAEAVALCEAVDSCGVRVNGDVGAMVAQNEDPLTTIAGARGWLGHFHVSEPALAEITDSPHQAAAATALAESGYSNWVSIEMRATAEGSRTEALRRVVATVSRLHAGGNRNR